MASPRRAIRRQGWRMGKRAWEEFLHSRISFLNKFRDRLVSLAEDLFVWQENDADVVGSGLLAEAGTMHDQHMFLHQEFFDEDVIAFGDVQSRKSIERAARRNATHSWRGVAPFD